MGTGFASLHTGTGTELVTSQSTNELPSCLMHSACARARQIPEHHRHRMHAWKGGRRGRRSSDHVRGGQVHVILVHVCAVAHLERVEKEQLRAQPGHPRSWNVSETQQCHFAPTLQVHGRHGQTLKVNGQRSRKASSATRWRIGQVACPASGRWTGRVDEARRGTARTFGAEHGDHVVVLLLDLAGLLRKLLEAQHQCGTRAHTKF